MSVTYCKEQPGYFFHSLPLHLLSPYAIISTGRLWNQTGDLCGLNLAVHLKRYRLQVTIIETNDAF